MNSALPSRSSLENLESDSHSLGQLEKHSQKEDPGDGASRVNRSSSSRTKGKGHISGRESSLHHGGKSQLCLRGMTSSWGESLQGCVVFKVVAETQMGRKHPVKSFFLNQYKLTLIPTLRLPELAGDSISVRAQALPLLGFYQKNLEEPSSSSDLLSLWPPHGHPPGLGSQRSLKPHDSLPPGIPTVSKATGPGVFAQ